MPRLFISYRRDDSAFAAQSIYDKLKELFGEQSITFDVNFSLGVDFAKKIDESVCRCDVLLAVIGDRWLDLRFADGPRKGQRRLDDPDDWVRLEIASALKRDILVIPVLVGKVSMPDIAPGLPPDLAELSKKVAISVRAGPDLPNDLQLLVRGVKRAIRLSPLVPADLALPPGVKVVPQGLRSFDEHDNGFFIYLLPGPYQEDGLPERLGFWKTRIEAVDTDTAFRVGLIYGPSGCGKSSLVRAGLLPRLGKQVTVVYVEATATDTEARLLATLHQHCPYLAGESSLLAALRRKDLIPRDKKVLLVLDQFEQYLHSTPEDEQDELAAALRECDGGRLQCILMVRDDFLTPSTRFTDRLQIPLAGDRNLALVDLFDRRHAKKVLALLGQAYGGLPASGNLRKEQDAFLNQAVSDLSDGDHVICVRLALFAAMVKDKEWKPPTLKAVGGATGVGAAFLEESFAAASAPEENRRHRAAAQRVLSALLPESGTSIKGAMRTKLELLNKSGYARRPDQFSQLLDILDKKLRLVTPTDPVNKSSQGQPERIADAERRYQLTHDYLVPSLRDWLTEKQKETRRGRAELRLAERSELWTAKPENHHLPSLWEFLNIRLLTKSENRTEQQRRMLRWATRFHARRTGFVAVVLAALATAALTMRGNIVEQQNATRAEGLVDALRRADIGQVPILVSDVAAYRAWANPLLTADLDQSKPGSADRLKLSLALLPVDESQVPYLREQLLVVTPQQFPIVRDALFDRAAGATGKHNLPVLVLTDPAADPSTTGAKAPATPPPWWIADVVEPLWAVALDAKRDVQPRFQAACALAKYDPQSKNWEAVQATVAGDLVCVPAVYLAEWMEALRGVRTKLVPQLSAIYRDAGRPDLERSLATSILADYAAEDAKALASLAMDADTAQFKAIYPKLAAQRAQALPVLLDTIKQRLSPDPTDPANESLAQRQVNAAVALLKLDQADAVWPLLAVERNSFRSTGWDPRARSYLIHRVAPLGADPTALVKRFDDEPDVSVRRALLLALGEFDAAALPADARNALIPKLQAVYRDQPDPGLHAAAQWLLHTWKQDAWLKQLNADWTKDDEQRAKRLAEIQQSLGSDMDRPAGHSPRWYVNSQGQTLVVVPGPVTFQMGSPDGESDETPHKVRIGRSFALTAALVTRAQFETYYHERGFADTYRLVYDKFNKYPEQPAVAVNWYMAADYCNWLSDKEGLAPCYEIGGLTLADNFQSAKVTLKANYLSLSGYRLPTEAEMEYATRASTDTSRYFGQTEELLPKYAWYLQNPGDNTHPVGLLKPNDLGLFDAHGNAWRWCQERYKPYPKGDAVSDDLEDDQLEVVATISRALRGGSFGGRPSLVRSACRGYGVPWDRGTSNGFRAARTLPLVPVAPFPPAAP